MDSLFKTVVDPFEDVRLAFGEAEVNLDLKMSSLQSLYVLSTGSVCCWDPFLKTEKTKWVKTYGEIYGHFLSEEWT